MVLTDEEKFKIMVEKTLLSESYPDLIQSEYHKTFGFKLKVPERLSEICNNNAEITWQIMTMIETEVLTPTNDFSFFITPSFEIGMQSKSCLWSEDQYKILDDVDNRDISKLKDGVDKLQSHKKLCEAMLEQIDKDYEIETVNTNGIYFTRLVKRDKEMK